MLLLALTNPMTVLPYLAASTVAGNISLFSVASLLGAAGATLGALSWYGALSGVTIACRQALAGAGRRCCRPHQPRGGGVADRIRWQHRARVARQSGLEGSDNQDEKPGVATRT
jgi:hypothetical protein